MHFSELKKIKIKTNHYFGLFLNETFIFTFNIKKAFFLMKISSLVGLCKFQVYMKNKQIKRKREKEMQ